MKKAISDVPHNKPGAPPLTSEQREKILDIALDRMVLIDGKVYGLEDQSEPDAIVDCASRIEICRANCCTYVFALTMEEVKLNFFKFNPERPYYMARDPDGYCPYLDRTTFKCLIHEQRPLRCRKYACSQESG